MAVSDDILELTPTQLDALREIGNVGAGNSATALSQIINHRIDMNVPEVSIVPLTEVPDLVGGPDVMVAGVFLRVYGAAPSNILFLLPQESAFYLVDMILGKQRGETKTLDFMDESALMEIGNILAGAYLNALQHPELYSWIFDIYGAINFAGIYPTMTAAETGAPFLGQFRQYFIAGNHDMYTFDLVHIPYARKLDELGLEYRFEIDNGEHSAAFFLPYLKEAFGYLMENVSVPDGETAAGENPVSIHDLQTETDGENLTVSFRAQTGDYRELLPYYVAGPSDQEETAGSLTVPLYVTVEENGVRILERTELWTLEADGTTAEEEFQLSLELPERGDLSSDAMEVKVTADLSWAFTE